ncbi:alpha/beta fold hydrolase [Streptomyces sp. NPDC059524]|uniref:alpha/beta fold hydrolase n=1 Tax=Streptomyces sp. NPDC059524 TaxID=3346856 RepID=UPI0036A84D2D
MTSRELLDLIPAPHPDTAALPPFAQRADGVRMVRGVPYGHVDGGRPLELDLWLPGPSAEGRPAPVVLFVHGGAWRRGRRDDMGLHTRSWDPGPFERLARVGFAVACVDYRLSGEATFPAPLDDLRTALRWLTLRGEELGIDPGRTVVWGESAGGHLASLLALTHDRPRPAAAVIWYGPADLTAPRPPFDPSASDTMEARLLGDAPVRVPRLARSASPVHQVGAGAPPFLLLHGEDDSMVHADHSRELGRALREAGAPVELRLVPHADHGWYGLTEMAVEDLFRQSLAFATQHVRGCS